jgi:hypothetical protein
VPGYVSLISGTGVEELGAISTEVGQLLARYKSLLAQVAGVVIILFGLHLTGLLRINALYADKRLHNVKGGSLRLGAFAIGSRKETRTARTVVLKLKTSEFKILTRSHTPGSSPSSYEELTDMALKLQERVDLGPQQRYRLVGIGRSNFREAEEASFQPAVFE